MKSWPRGFTLVELLIVMLILALTVGLVAPSGYKVVERATAFLERTEESSFEKRSAFQAFIQDEDCNMAFHDGEIVFSCIGQVVSRKKASQPIEPLRITNKGIWMDLAKKP